MKNYSEKHLRKNGKILKTLFFTFVILCFVIGGGYAAWQRVKTTAKVEPPQLVTVKKEKFIHEILERGSVESASNIDVRCQVESAGGLTIISVVSEGTVVKKGDLLVELDSSTLRENVTKQRIAVLASQSKLAQSIATLKTAKLTLQEYVDGKFKEEEKQIYNEMLATQDEVRTKEDNLSYYKRLLERGYVTNSKVEADLFDLDKAQNSFELAKIKLEVLQNITKEKYVVQYEADITKAEAQVKADQESLNLDEDRLKHLETQLSLCRITAPQDGQVIYYLPRWGGDEDLIKEGKKVVERQMLIRLPDPSQMQVKGLVNEANIRLVKVGQTAKIRLEAFPNREFNGVVKIVNDYPEPGNWMGGSMSKEYMTTIMILDPPEGIKPGLTAEARIAVSEISGAVLVPVQAVFAHGNKTYSLVFNNDKWDKVEVKIGPSNDKEVVILEGLKEGEPIVLGAWSHRDKVDLPKISEEENGKEGREGKPDGSRKRGPRSDGIRSDSAVNASGSIESGDKSKESGGSSGTEKGTEGKTGGGKGGTEESSGEKNNPIPAAALPK
ncbi:hypothetical protein FACS189427_02500 [Planctomycetales bacterium]|nr:hypothetical protein FACS189427_02500 [Planctomycetales bacterium]